jgi:hypothetical protein
MNMQFPKPIPMQVDNTAAIAFVSGTCFNSELKHIDMRQQWVRDLQDATILIAVWCQTKENLADFFTKILKESTFDYLLEKMFKQAELRERNKKEIKVKEDKVIEG